MANVYQCDNLVYNDVDETGKMVRILIIIASLCCGATANVVSLGMENSTTFANRRFVVDGKAPCSNCKEEKPVADFAKSSASAIGLKSHCKACVAAHRKATTTPERLAAKRLYGESRKAERAAYNKANKERIYLQRKQFRDNCSPERKAAEREKSKVYAKEVQRNNLSNRLMLNMTLRIERALGVKIGRVAARRLLKCTAKELICHLKAQFQPGMSWANYGRRDGDLNGWEMDHIRPCRAFDFSKQADREACFHRSNVQPLWAKDNCRKNAIT